MEVKDKLPTFLKIVTIVGFVLVGLNLLSSSSFISGPLSAEEIDSQQIQIMQMFNSFPKEMKEAVKPMLSLVEVLERNYVYSKVVPFFAMLIVWVGNILLRRRKLIGMHLVIAGIIATAVSTYMAVSELDIAILYTFSNFFFLFVYAGLVIANRKHLT